MINLETLGQSQALLACAAVQGEAIRRQLAVVVAVSDVFGEVIVVSRMDGAPIGSVRVAANKVYSAARERKASGDIGTASRAPASGFDIGFFGDARLTGWPGGLPVTSQDAVVGAVGVSGASDQLDEELAVLGVNAILNSRGKGRPSP